MSPLLLHSGSTVSTGGKTEPGLCFCDAISSCTEHLISQAQERGSGYGQLQNKRTTQTKAAISETISVT